LTATGEATGTTTGLNVSVSTGTTNYAALFSGGNVGIGTATPGQLLEVKSGNVLLSNAGTAGQLQLQGTGSGATTIQAGAQGASTIAYTLPTAQGSTGSVLTNSNGAGALTWNNPTSTITMGVSSPAAYSANQNDLVVVTSTVNIYRISSTANIDITGIDTAGVSTGRVVTFVNVGANTIRFMNQNTGSLAQNRFITNSTGAAEQLGANDAITLWYDGTSTRWRTMNKNY
jgi:hypothetical protein